MGWLSGGKLPLGPNAGRSGQPVFSWSPPCLARVPESYIEYMVNPLWFVLGMVIFFSVFLTVVSRLEKRVVCPFGELESSRSFDDPTGYASRWVSDAGQAGFSFLGWARDTRSATYRLGYAMLVSPDRNSFAVICVGTMLKIPFQATWLYTPGANGQTFCTTDSQSGVQIDVSHNWRNQLAAGVA